eukprot:3353756-Ditylum_brightwellii.AAC.1
MRGQIIGMNSCVTMGKYVFHVGMLSILPEELYSVTDWATDTLVLMIASYTSARKILGAPFQDEKTKTMLVTTLLFFLARRLKLIHCNNLSLNRDTTRGYNLGKGVNDYMPKWNTDGGPVNIFNNEWKQQVPKASVTDSIWCML